MDPRRTFLLVVLGSGLAGGVQAQEPPEFRLPAGTRVRMTVAGSPVEGYLSGRDADSLRLALPSDNPFAQNEIAVPLSVVTRVELHVGRKRHTRTGALVGALVMGVAGIWEPVDSSPSCNQWSAAFCSRVEAVAITALAGAALGGIIGHAIKTDQWTPVAMDALAVMPPTPSEIREAPGGPGRPAGLKTPARLSVRF